MGSIPKQEVTLKTIAKMAQVSHTTVSRALNDSPAVRPETKAKIRAIAKQVGYVPNLTAKGLVTKRSYMIGIFFTDLSTGTSASFLTDVISQAQHILPSGYALAINDINNTRNNQTLLEHNYDGIIVLSQSRSDDNFIAEVHDRQMPIVVLNRPIARDDIPNYSVNDFIGAQNIVAYAIRMGHQNFGLIKGVPSFESTTQRTRGFFNTLHQHGLTIDSELVKQGDYKPKSGNVAMRQILTSGKIPTCVFCENDDMAIGAINACKELGFQVPEDISFIGYDDMAYSKYMLPGLTTVRKPTGQIINLGITKLTALLNDTTEQVQPDKQNIAPEIIVRGSVYDRRN
ncbi:transcriptional regulator, LacI family [Agrilactobacillus composti DSM 18527 = JCM 14202]|uniref:Transcriptional regulator, LacI family n=1 Tax=Agrilactobacillus composti DSM 18527 = JCM 14202 TaxID=1423734 RepID=X0QQ46_9LACO|nr:LacI family DNA-binding transcriptional regulator [Agrilactobacillus composti]KRM33418.1 transcriptional regulator, LacI family [Agrilactobacillus composti DSM 18527 = JCM 14202]GAF40750.1 hexuronate utilization operon transcriptional repressor ExuR [Agrilactobacillus composti DSM 18527 = JCM 14202]